MNASDPQVGSLVYDTVRWKGKGYAGTEGAEILLQNQLEGIKECVGLGMAVKINIVMIPGINDEHIPELVKAVKSLGVYMVNILPLIPVDGTKFSSMRAPTPEERKNLMDKCELDVKMMRHCRQCRADAVGLLGEDRSSEFARMGSCQAGCGPSARDPAPMIKIGKDEPTKIAVATSDGKNVDSGFGNASRFDVYSISDEGVRLVRTVRIDTSGQVAGGSHREHIENIIEQMNDCGVFVVKEIGHMPSRLLAERGKTVRMYEGVIGKKTFRPE
jgi:nitrogen fixation protein NifB